MINALVLVYVNYTVDLNRAIHQSVKYIICCMAEIFVSANFVNLWKCPHNEFS